MAGEGFTYAWKEREWWIGEGNHPSFFVGSACEVVATEIGDVTICPGWNGDDPYVFARIPIPDLPERVQRTGSGGRLVPASHGSFAALPWNGEADALVVMVGQSPRAFRRWGSSGEVWEAAMDAIRLHVVPQMTAWRATHADTVVQVRVEQIRVQIDKIEASMEGWRRRSPEELAAHRATMEELLPRLKMLWARLQAVGIVSPYWRWPGGVDDATLQTSRGPVELSLHQYRRLSMLVAVKDAGLRTALTSLMEQWWVHWFDALGPTLGWLEVGETLEATTRRTTRDRRVIVPSGRERYPPEYPADPEAEQVFRKLEWQMLLAAYRMLYRPYNRAKKELEEVARRQTRRDRRLAELRAEIARLESAASPEDALRPPAGNAG